MIKDFLGQTLFLNQLIISSPKSKKIIIFN